MTNRMKLADVTLAGIAELQQAAGSAGDMETVTDCEKALYSPRGKAARVRCVKIIVESSNSHLSSASGECRS